MVRWWEARARVRFCASAMRVRIFYPLVRPPVQAPAKVRLAGSVMTTHAAITTRASRIVLCLEVSFHRRVDCAERGECSACVLWIHTTLLHQHERLARTDAGIRGPLCHDELVVLPDRTSQCCLVVKINVTRRLACWCVWNRIDAGYLDR